MNWTSSYWVCNQTQVVEAWRPASTVSKKQKQKAGAEDQYVPPRYAASAYWLSWAEGTWKTVDAKRKMYSLYQNENILITRDLELILIWICTNKPAKITLCSVSSHILFLFTVPQLTSPSPSSFVLLHLQNVVCVCVCVCVCKKYVRFGA